MLFHITQTHTPENCPKEPWGWKVTDQEPSGLLGVGESEYHQVPLSDGLSWLKHRIEDLSRRARKMVSDWKPEDAQRAAEKLLESLENLSERVAASAHPSRPRAGIRAFHAAADSKIRSSAPPFRRSPFSSPNTAMSASSASAM